MKRVLLLLAFVGLVLYLSGCPKDPYRASLQGSDDVSNTVHAVVNITTSYYGNGLVDENEKRAVATVLNVVTDGNFAFRHCVVVAHNAPAAGQAPFLGCASAFAAQASAIDPTSIGFKNAKAQAALQNSLKALKAAVDGISLAVQAAKGGK